MNPINPLLPLTLAAILSVAAFAQETSAPAEPAEPGPAKLKPVLIDFMGINGNVGIFPGELYAPTCRLIRDYHTMDWNYGDDPANALKYPLTTKEIVCGKDYPGGMNWIQKYTDEYLVNGFRINACIQNIRSKQEQWEAAGHEETAARIGREMAIFFGPSGENKLIESFQIENEPSNFTPEFYKDHLRYMGQAIRQADPKIKIVTCNIQAGEIDKYSKPTSCLIGNEEYYDVIAIHTYALADRWPTYRRSFPEDPINRFQQVVQNLIDWRNENAQGKEIWVTEFGWDATTAPTPPQYPESSFVDVSDTQQAQYIVRAFLSFAEMDVDRAYLYYFDDQNVHSLHASSGITRNFQPKASYWAMKHLLETLGRYRFNKAIEKQPHYLYLFEFVKEDDSSDRIYAVWSPSGHNREFITELDLPAQPVNAERMPLEKGPAPNAVYEITAEGKVKLTVSESPVYLWVKVPDPEKAE